MEFTKAVDERHSFRDFSDRQVSKEDLTSIIDTAKKAPSWANSQTWKVVIATGNTLKQIKEHHLAAAQRGETPNPEIPALHRDAMGDQGIENVGEWMSQFNQFMQSESSAMSTQSAHLFNAPAIAYLLVPKNTSLWEAYDLGAFGQTLMLAATDKGIDSIPAMEFVQYPDGLHQILGVDSQYIFAVGIGLGYRKDGTLINKFRSTRMDDSKFLQIKD